jgi:RNA polymerase sigma factor (TIGR02999 family)
MGSQACKIQNMVANPALTTGPTARYRAVPVFIHHLTFHPHNRDKYSLIDTDQCPAMCKDLYANVVPFARKQTKGMTDRDSITGLLQQWRGGDTAALGKLSPLVYQELHRIADYLMRRERQSHTLQPTALVHEAFLKLLGNEINWSDRKHFYAVAARQMRRILVDYTRARKRKKRGSDYLRVTLDENCLAQDPGLDLLEIDDALGKLHKLDPRKHDMLELYYFAGLTIEEIAKCYELSTKTVQRELRLAEAWLHTALDPDEDNLSTVEATGHSVSGQRRSRYK